MELLCGGVAVAVGGEELPQGLQQVTAVCLGVDEGAEGTADGVADLADDGWVANTTLPGKLCSIVSPRAALAYLHTLQHVACCRFRISG